MNFQKSFDYGRFLRSFAAEPRTSLVRAEDLSYCASKLMLARQLLRREQPQFAEMISDTLQDMAQVNPDAAVRRVEGSHDTFGGHPIYWGLACHCLAQTLSEYSREAPSQTVTHLRTSLVDWFPSFQSALEVFKEANEELRLVALQVFLVQSAIFHDPDSMDWGLGKLLNTLSPENITLDEALESAAVLAGAFAVDGDEPGRVKIAQLFEGYPEGTHDGIDAIRRTMGSVSMPDQPTSTAQAYVPKEFDRSSVVTKAKRRSPAELFRALSQAYGFLIMPTILLVLVGGCVFGFGKAYDWFENTSHVGDQSLGQWYDNLEDANEDKREAERGGPQRGDAKANGESPAPTPTPRREITDDDVANVMASSGDSDIPAGADYDPFAGLVGATGAQASAPPPPPTMVQTPLAIPTPSVSTESLSSEEQALRTTISMHEKWMKPKVSIARMIASANGQTEKQRGIYKDRFDVRYERRQNQMTAIVNYYIDWYVGSETPAEQFIETHYAWNGSEWKLVGAARCLNRKNDAGEMLYMLEQAELQWARSLFHENPFY